MDKIRNFCIIAHIDHWKSTLADRLLEITWTVKEIKHWQILDSLDLEQERWITIKLAPARMNYKWYELNLIDTPWHVDFQYEVSRSLACVEWAILLVDWTQWIQAQTISNLNMAIQHWLKIIPVINKIDLPSCNFNKTYEELKKLVNEEAIWISAKTWLNVDILLDKIIQKIPSPVSKYNFARWVIFDSVYDKYKWVVIYVRVLDWVIKEWDFLYLIHSKTYFKVLEVWYFWPWYIKDDKLLAWQIWYIVTWLKSVRDAKVWDTLISNINDKEKYIFPWFREPQPFVYSWVYSLNNEYFKLKDALDKYSLNDSSIVYFPISNLALWQWFNVWFLWFLHMEIVKERLKREYGVETIFTLPTVPFLVKLKRNIDFDLNIFKFWYRKDILTFLLNEWRVDFLYYDYLEKDELNDEEKNNLKDILKNWILVNWWNIPQQVDIDEVLEPYLIVKIITPLEFSWDILNLSNEYRWILKDTESWDNKIIYTFMMPASEIIVDFYDKLKTITHWYWSMNYKNIWFFKSDMVRLDIYINKELIEPFTRLVHRSKSYELWKKMVEKLKDLIPRHLFPIPIQAWVWSKIIARETIPALRKDVLAKCYWWDVTRKRKLLEKQKEWKKKLAQLWQVNVPSDIFIKILKQW